MCDVNHVFVDQPQNKDYQTFDLFEIEFIKFSNK